MTYGYDIANQLTSITYTKGSNTIGDLQYVYDAGGRRVQVSGSLAATDLPATVASAVYNANNQLTSWAGTIFTYDLNGNLTSDGTKTYTWNAKDQLTAISGGVTASFAYDGAGRRKSKTIGGIQTGFLYDGLNFVQELAGSTPTANLITDGIDQLFQRKEGSTPSYPITDALGSVIGLTDSAGSLQTQYTFQPYGKATRVGAANNNSQSYTGREDDNTGLFYYRARYYTPGSSRFISEDPIGIAGGINMYAYVEGNPLSNVDPLGLQALPIPLPPPPVPGGAGTGTGSGWDWGGSNSWKGSGSSTQGKNAAAQGSDKGRGRYYCKIRCNVYAIGDCKTCPDLVFGHGFGGTENEAWNNAWDSANGGVPKGCGYRHCHGVGGSCKGRTGGKAH